MRTQGFREFASNSRGNFSIATAVLLVPLVVAAGFAVDFSRVEENKNRIQQALDAGTMAAAAKFNGGASESEAVAEGKLVFAANCPLPECLSGDPVFAITPGEKVTGTRETSLDTTLMRLAGAQSVDLNLLSEVNLNYRFQEFRIVVDRSASLGIGADKENIEKLMAITEPYFSDTWWIYDKGDEGCAFACHFPVANEPYRNGKQLSSYDIAKENNIELREDVLLGAVDTAADTILEYITGTHADQIRVAAYAFSDDLEVLTQNPTSNSTNIKKKIENSSITNWGTRYDVALPKLAKIVGTSGSGSTNKDPQKTVILITDGQFTKYESDKTKTQWRLPFDSSYCDEFKNNGVRMVVVDLEYPDLAGNYWYDTEVKPHKDQISPALEACATTGYYYQANDTPQIQVTLIKMAKQVKQAELAFTK